MFIIHINIKTAKDLLKVKEFCREESHFTYQGQILVDGQRRAVVTTTVEHGAALVAALV